MVHSILRDSVMVLVAALVLPTLVVQAETWTDSTGQFRIEAKYAGVQGSSVVLEKPDGTTLNVPIARLSPESRAQAKRLYEMSKSGGATTLSPPPPTSPIAPGAPATSGSSANPGAPVTLGTTASSSLRSRSLNFAAPEPRAIGAMPPFPENASLQQTVDFVRDQVLAGHLEVVWYILPEEMRQTFDSPEHRQAIMPMIQDQQQLTQPLEDVALKLIELLIKQKQFVLNTAMLKQIPPPLMGTVQQGYDPAVGALYEITDWSFNLESLRDQTVTQWVNYHGPRIGGHLKELAALAPPGMIDQITGQIRVEQATDASGTISVTSGNGETQTTEWIRYQGRWLPKELAENWEAKKETFVADFSAQMLAAKDANPEARAQAMFYQGMIQGMAERALDPLLAAKSQQEFDQALMQVVAVMGMMGGAGGQGGPGQPGGGPGNGGGGPGFGGPGFGGAGAGPPGFGQRPEMGRGPQRSGGPPRPGGPPGAGQPPNFGGQGSDGPGVPGSGAPGFGPGGQ